MLPADADQASTCLNELAAARQRFLDQIALPASPDQN
jgi:hypothetical protein